MLAYSSEIHAKFPSLEKLYKEWEEMEELQVIYKKENYPIRMKMMLKKHIENLVNKIDELERKERR